MEGSAVLHRADSEETMELWDVYDIDRQKTGKLAQRVNGKSMPEGEYHLVVHICLMQRDSCSFSKGSLIKSAIRDFGMLLLQVPRLPEKTVPLPLPGNFGKKWAFATTFMESALSIPSISRMDLMMFT